MAKGGIASTRRQLYEMRDLLLRSPTFYWDTETDGKHHERKAIGMSFANHIGTSWYVPMRHNDGMNANLELVREILEEIFCTYGEAGCKRTCWAHNKPFDLQVSRNEGILPRNFKVAIKDCMVLSWMVNPDDEKGLKPLVLKHFGYEMVTFKALKDKYGENADIPVKVMAPYAIDDVRFLPRLVKLKYSALASAGPALIKAFNELETPIGDIIDRMQATGFKIDVPRIRELDRTFGKKLHEIEGELSRTIGLPRGKLKIGSTQWLSSNFIDLHHWWTPREDRGASGHFSTRREMLEEWAAGVRSTSMGRKIAQLLLTQRGLAKLKSTYTKTLPDKVDANHRLHSTFKQAGTRTGRFSSASPNLQNIPIRTDEGRLLREAFIADKGYQLVVADFSQVELRILAHYSQDPSMVRIYRTGGDIHQNTADSVGCARSQAKGINFGINYGMGPVKFAVNLKCSVLDARRWIAGYHHEYMGVKYFQARTHNKTREDGFVSTLVGRRRYLPDIRSRINWKRAAAERQSVNTIIQGSAADIIMIGMRNIERRLRREGITYTLARVLSQVHDELIYEVRESYVERVKKILQEEMESAVKLSVPLIAIPESGKTWAEAH